MIITGYTDNRLNEVKTYNTSSPYQIGVNGVIDIIYNTGGTINNVVYIIDGIKYTTFFPIENDTAITYINGGTPLRRPGVQNLNTSSRTRSFTPKPTNGDNSVREANILYRTIFEYNPNGCDVDYYNVLKEEVKIGVVFPPKVEEQIFIERMSISVFEQHARMSEITTLDNLEDYRNGYYNIVKTD